MRPLTDLEPEVNPIQPMPYTAFQALLDATAPPGKRGYWRGEYLDSLTDAAIATFAQRAPDLVTAAAPLSQGVIFRIGQAIADVPEVRPRSRTAMRTTSSTRSRRGATPPTTNGSSPCAASSRRR